MTTELSATPTVGELMKLKDAPHELTGRYEAFQQSYGAFLKVAEQFNTPSAQAAESVAKVRSPA